MMSGRPQDQQNQHGAMLTIGKDPWGRGTAWPCLLLLTQRCFDHEIACPLFVHFDTAVDHSRLSMYHTSVCPL